MNNDTYLQAVVASEELVDLLPHKQPDWAEIKRLADLIAATADSGLREH